MSKIRKTIADALRQLLNAIGVRSVACRVNGRRYRMPLWCASLRHVVVEKNDHYEEEVYFPTMDLARGRTVVFDIGAHLGEYTLGFADAIAPDGVVVAFECNPQAAKAIREILALEGLQTRVRVENCAVGDKIGEVTFDAEGFTNPGQKIVHRADASSSTYTVAAVTVDSFSTTSKLRPQLIKIDVEGYELKVLQGARRTLVESGPVINCEIHPEQLRGLGSTPAEVEQYLLDLGYAAVPGLVHEHVKGNPNRPYNKVFCKS